MARPSLFIGSSSEGLDFARAARALLGPDVEATLWNEGFFRPGSTFIETLVNALPRFDFALLVLTPDDLTISRGAETLSPRDNVIFELGLFMGRLGRSRTFLLYQANAAVRIPTDLAGVTAATYDWPRSDDNHEAAVGPACDSIRRVVRDLGISDTKTARVIGDITDQQERQAKQLSQQQAQIRSLQLALRGIVTQYELDKLIGLSGDAPFMCYYSDDLYAELKQLRAKEFVHHHAGVGLSAMRQRYKDRHEMFDLKQFFYITKQGEEYLSLRRQVAAES